MDWTSIYAEAGDEELVLQPLIPSVNKLRESRLARLVSVVYVEEDPKTEKGENHIGSSKTPSSYDLSAIYFLSINYILGVGCLGVPYAFAKSGLILGSVLIILVSIISFVTVMWIAECGEVARYLNHKITTIERIDPFKKHQLSKINNGIVEYKNENTELLQRAQSNFSQAQTNSDSDDHYEVIELISRFLGPIHQVIYQISLMGLMYVGLLAYSQVFTGSISAILPQDTPDFLSTILFSVIVIPLSCIELDEQITLQALMAAFRFVAIFIMIGESLIALCVDHYGINRRTSFPFFAEPKLDEMSYTVSFAGFGIAFSTALFSQLFQHSIPGLLKPLNEIKSNNSIIGSSQTKIKDLRNDVPKTFAAALLTTAIIYLFLGCIAASYFGASTSPSVNLNFVDFKYGVATASKSGSSYYLNHLISNIIVFFPALDTLSVFPLIANTLGNNLLASTGNASSELPSWIDKHILTVFYDSLIQSPNQDMTSERRYKSARITSILFRLVAAVPPLFLSLYVTDLSFSLQLAGLCGLYVAFFAPVLLYLESSKRLRQDGHSFTNIYFGWWSNETFCAPILFFAIFSFCNVVYHIIKICLKVS